MKFAPKKVRDIANDIKTMKIRGAGEIARSAVTCLSLIAKESKAKTVEGLIKDLNYTAEVLLKTRPTAVSLPNGIRYVMKKVIKKSKNTSDLEEIRASAIEASEQFIKNSLMAIKKIGEIGARRIQEGDTILTHCHSTAVISILKTAHNQGKKIKVYSTETRPRYQGRITAKILGEAGIPVTMIIDSATRYFMRKMNAVIVGADAVAANGAVVNKIGTSLIALAANESRVTFFVAAETYKFSPKTMLGELVTIEERSPMEVISLKKLQSMENVTVLNPAFDVTPPEYIDLIITERGIIPPQGAISILRDEFGWMTTEESLEF